MYALISMNIKEGLEAKNPSLILIRVIKPNAMRTVRPSAAQNPKG